MFSKWLVACVGLGLALAVPGCTTTNKNSSAPAAASNANGTTVTAGDNAVAGVERVKPAAGTGNVQGKVLYNSQPAQNVEVKLCEKFNQFLGGCSGQTYTARTDANGEYVITNVPPSVYEGLLARVFETDSFIFAASGIGGLSSTKYDVKADKTLFVAPTNLFKDDLKLLNPKAGAKVSAQNLELSWAAYPAAAYYKFSIYPEDSSVSAPYVNERVDATSYAVDKPLPAGTYRWQVEAYNDGERKLAESSRDIKFTIQTSAAAPQP